ncbi:hypothetical protein GGTG_12743 [Gaeumannomyces tritici R3-111a-1]|uniref:Uncharacterized protein n=1 Tax=Gaeumannomyces tritici (strain R3-111a-1) TaxID=644352 RepID=J3PGW3_GAET3|nr:hypothetical protein GGTG_12743 [Gaeumannomyces tritici R3-111a-1]EJT69860.1 hypothetical protein GGTG_12743 [Gaeumannomyces tritici R3-111a-1]
MRAVPEWCLGGTWVTGQVRPYIRLYQLCGCYPSRDGIRLACPKRWVLNSCLEKEFKKQLISQKRIRA